MRSLLTHNWLACRVLVARVLTLLLLCGRCLLALANRWRWLAVLLRSLWMLLISLQWGCLKQLGQSCLLMLVTLQHLLQTCRESLGQLLLLMHKLLEEVSQIWWRYQRRHLVLLLQICSRCLKWLPLCGSLLLLLLQQLLQISR